MLDNLRRTLFAPAAFLTLIAGWTLPLASPVIWTTFVLGMLSPFRPYYPSFLVPSRIAAAFQNAATRGRLPRIWGLPHRTLD